VIDEFGAQGVRIPPPVLHSLSVEEKLAMEIVRFERACYWEGKLFIACEFSDGATQWVAGSSLQQSRVGRKLLQRAYRNGILRYHFQY
jgi:hypothetical protein